MTCLAIYILFVLVIYAWDSAAMIMTVLAWAGTFVAAGLVIWEAVVVQRRYAAILREFAARNAIAQPVFGAATELGGL